MVDLYNEDCIGVIKSLPDNSVDFILTDPPYNISRKNNFTTMGRTGIDFGEWDKEADITSWLKEVPRILKKDGGIIIFSSWENLGDIAKNCEDNGLQTKDIIRWVKRNPMPRNIDRRYVVDYELAVWFVKKGGNWVFNRLSNSYQRPEYICSIVSGKEKTVHPTQKPVELMSKLLKVHTNEGQTVFDPFMGSGSTGVACEILKRNFIGVELDTSYYNIAKARIEKQER